MRGDPRHQAAGIVHLRPERERESGSHIGQEPPEPPIERRARRRLHRRLALQQCDPTAVHGYLTLRLLLGIVLYRHINDREPRRMADQQTLLARRPPPRRKLVEGTKPPARDPP